MNEQQNEGTPQNVPPLPQYIPPLPPPVPQHAAPYGQAYGGGGMFQQGPQQHQVPRCLRCGTVTWWKPAPLLRLMDCVVVGVLFLLFGAGLIYLIIMLIVRSNPNNREKICPFCNNNQWTYIY